MTLSIVVTDMDFIFTSLIVFSTLMERTILKTTLTFQRNFSKIYKVVIQQLDLMNCLIDIL